MKLLRLIALLFFNFHLMAQTEYVINGSLEDYSNCPSFDGQLGYCINWNNPTQTTPDYYNDCSTSMGIPDAGGSGGYGFQFPHTGQAMAAIWAYCSNTDFPNVREYIQATLQSSLNQDRIYLVEFFVNRSNWSDHACNNIGGLFTNSSSLNSDVNGLITANPQILSFQNRIVLDTANWTKISSVYISNGTENYLTIGNFRSDAETDTVYALGTFEYSAVAYYYIDDVSVIEIATPQWQYSDTTINEGDSAYIGNQISNLNVDWYDINENFIENTPALLVQPTVTTKYIAKETFNGTLYVDTVTVTVLPTIGIEELNEDLFDVSLYPNPSSKQITIEAGEVKGGSLQITIYDLSGKVVYDENKLTNSGIITVEPKLLSGTYVAKITNVHTNEFVNKRLIIQH